MNATIRTFRASDTRSALAAVKAALGPEAVILGTRSIPRGLLRGPEIEVTAALQPPEPAQPPVQTPRLEAAAQQPGPPAERPFDGALAVELASLRDALAEARRELRRVSQESRTQLLLQLDADAARVHDGLVRAGVEPAIAEEVVRQAQQQRRGGDLHAEVRALIERRVSAARPPWLRGGARVLAFVGPTGVGKTTTLAKVAARAVIESRMKVALVTVDTYRVGGSEQLARYGEILGAPAHVARNQQELMQAVARCGDADLVLVDTAGRSTSEAVAQQAASIRGVPGVQLHLVVRAASGHRDLEAVAARYRRLSPERIVVSKVDEAVAPGCVLSALVRMESAVSCLANGQRVPEDLCAASAADLAELALGGPEHAHAAVAGR